MTIQVETDEPKPTVPKEVTDAEQRVIDKSPEQLRAEEEQIAKELNEAIDKAVEGAPAEREKAAEKDPGVDELATELSTIASGGSVPLSGVLASGGTVIKEVKAGYKTTEFWVSVAVIVLTQLGTLHLPGKYGQTIATAVTAGAYAISRGLAK